MQQSEWDGTIESKASVFSAIGIPEPGKPEYTISEMSSCRGRGVYFVWDGDEIVYIGKTSNFQSRMRGHHKGFTGAEMVSWVGFERFGNESLAELFYIGVYQPKLNREVQESCSGESEWALIA